MTHQNRKRIGLLIGDIDGMYQRHVWSNIQQAAENEDCNVIAFEGRDIEASDSDRQHNIVYDMARFAKFDGYIVMGTEISRFVSHEKYEEFLFPFTRSGNPVISIGVQSKGARSILIDNETGFKELMEHLISFHGYRKIAFIGGPEMNDEAALRKKVYLDALRRHSLPVQQEWIFDGDFSPTSGHQAMKSLTEKKLQVDCIVCANDITAFGVYQYIQEHQHLTNSIDSYRITGFDDTSFSKIIKPSLTTIRQPFSEMMRLAVSWINNPGDQNVDEYTMIPTSLVVRESCGCSFRAPQGLTEGLYLTATRRFRAYQKMQTFSLDAFYSQISDILDQSGIGDFFLVMYPQAFNYPSSMSGAQDAELLYARVDGKVTILDQPIPFRSSTLVPKEYIPSDDVRQRRYTWLVKPLFFDTEQFGYIILEPEGEDTRNYDAVRGQISNTLKVALLLNHQKEIERRLEGAVTELQSFNEKLNLLSAKDPLCGLYNRRGFFDAINFRFSQDRNQNESFLVLFADIDQMKLINDCYGHFEGDEAIRATAKILSGILRGDDIVARIGGDEFSVVASDAGAELYPVLLKRIEKALKAYNEESGKPYRLGISIGYAEILPHQQRDLEDALKRADRRLYEIKQKKKRNREKEERMT